MLRCRVIIMVKVMVIIIKMMVVVATKTMLQ